MGANEDTIKDEIYAIGESFSDARERVDFLTDTALVQNSTMIRKLIAIRAILIGLRSQVDELNKFVSQGRIELRDARVGDTIEDLGQELWSMGRYQVIKFLPIGLEVELRHIETGELARLHGSLECSLVKTEEK